MAIDFRHSEHHSVGIEIEVQLVDRESLDLTHTSAQIIENIDGFEDSIKHELMMSNLEINTKVCQNLAEAEKDLFNKFNVVASEADRHNTLLLCAGGHPFSLCKDQQITKDRRYKRLMEKLQVVARRFNIFGLHVHVGIGSAEKCIYVMNQMIYYLPHLLALSANSPFWEGEHTGLKSYRTKVFENLPTAGLPFYFENWDDYAQLVKNYIATDTIETIREIWWDIRPHPDFGTLELRICDAPSSIKEVLAITALTQCLAASFSSDFDRGIKQPRIHPSVTRENKWRACRYGLDADLITENGKETIPAREAIRKLAAQVEKEAAELGALKHLKSIDEILENGDGASRQLRYWKERGELSSVVRGLTKDLSEEIAKYGKAQ
ncbi:MAG: glutamate--cysteine ligase [Proteobacteria bacterium]|nr:glutamate--cysteine ligase [Pseudomonadota bacterium]